MAISAISGNTVQNVNFQGKKHPRENIDRFLEMDDMQLAQIARDKALNDYNKRHRKTFALFLSTPLVAGISSAILANGNTRFLTKEVSGRAAKLAAGINGATKWAVALGAFAAVYGAINLGNKSEKIAEFRRKHGLVSFASDITAMGVLSTLAYTAAGIFSGKLKPETVQKIAKKVGTSADFINGIKLPKFLQSAKETVAKHFPDAMKPSNLVKNAPDWIKSTGKKLISWTPYIALTTALFKSFADSGKAVSDWNRNFIYLKNKQDKLAEVRNNELNPIDE